MTIAMDDGDGAKGNFVTLSWRWTERKLNADVFVVYNIKDRTEGFFGYPEINVSFDPRLNTLTFDSNGVYDIYLNRDAGDCSVSV